MYEGQRQRQEEIHMSKFIFQHLLHKNYKFWKHPIYQVSEIEIYHEVNFES